MPTTKPTSKILLELLSVAGTGAVDFYTMLHDLKFHRGAYLRGGHGYVKELQKLRDAKKATPVLKRLQTHGYVQVAQLGQRLLVSLTAKGQQATLAAQLRSMPKLGGNLYTVVIFDVPQSEGPARRQLRWLLRQGGFVMLQQSVWISRADTYHPLTKFITRLKLEPWVNVFYARNFLHLPRRLTPLN